MVTEEILEEIIAGNFPKPIKGIQSHTQKLLQAHRKSQLGKKA